MYTLVLIVLSMHIPYSVGITNIPGFTTMDNCMQAATTMQMTRVDNGFRQIKTMCVEVK